MLRLSQFYYLIILQQFYLFELSLFSLVYLSSKIVSNFKDILQPYLEEIEEIVVNEDGSESVVKKTVNVADPNDYSEYARFYDDGCIGWDKNSEYSLAYLKNIQNWANNKLQAEGHLFLNEVYEALGIPKTKAGQVVGWVYDEANPDCDNFVDFGISDIYNAKVRDFVNGYERVVLLDFNVDGVVWDILK